MAREKFERNREHVDIGTIGTSQYISPTTLSRLVSYMSTNEEKLEYLRYQREELAKKKKMVQLSDEDFTDLEVLDDTKKSTKR